jgi:peptide-methionine (S)-S-oxide reductase
VLFSHRKTTLVAPAQALPGRDRPAFDVPPRHAVLGTPLQPPFPAGLQTAQFALGCFWGAERLFWRIDGVYTTAVGYAGGFTPNPTYEEVCTGRTGHAETVLVVFDPARVAYGALLRTFFEAHDPTQGMRQGNDVGTQYRSAVYTADEAQRSAAEEVRAAYATRLREAGLGPVTTEVAPAGPFYYAEDYHQQYLHKVPGGYCGLAGTGVDCPEPGAATAAATAAAGGDSESAAARDLPSSEEEWRRRLTPQQFAVLRQAATEPPFTGRYVDTDTDGMYHCAACGGPLFDSRTKYHSGSGWPSFTHAVAPGAVEILEDRSHGMYRLEVRCARCHSHLGHVFDDGPVDQGGQRWCMNSAALDLKPR